MAAMAARQSKLITIYWRASPCQNYPNHRIGQSLVSDQRPVGPGLSPCAVRDRSASNYAKRGSDLSIPDASIHERAGWQ
jgi:hypothetical protein